MPYRTRRRHHEDPPLPPRRRRRRARACSRLVAAACSDPPTSAATATRSWPRTARSQLPECPLDALEEADGPAEITLWYGGIGGPVKDTMEHMVTGFNASQDDVVLDRQRPGPVLRRGVPQVRERGGGRPSQLPDIVYLEDTQLQVLADSGLILPAQSCMEADGYDMTDIEPAVRSTLLGRRRALPGLHERRRRRSSTTTRPTGCRPGSTPRTRPGRSRRSTRRPRRSRPRASPKPLSFKVSPLFFENWLTGEGVDVVNNDNGRDGLATEATFDTPEAEDAPGAAAEDERRGPAQRVRQHRGRRRPLPGAGDPGLVDADRDLDGVERHRRRPGRPADRPRTSARTSTRRSSTRPSWCPASGPFPGHRRRRARSTRRRRVLHRQHLRAGAAGGVVEVPASSCSSPTTPRRGTSRAAYLPIVKSVSDEPDVQAFWEDTLAGVLRQAGGRAAPGRRPRPARAADRALRRLRRRREAAMEAVLFDDGDIRRCAGRRAQDEVTESLERYGATERARACDGGAMRRTLDRHA